MSLVKTSSLDIIAFTSSDTSSRDLHIAMKGVHVFASAVILALCLATCFAAPQQFIESPQQFIESPQQFIESPQQLIENGSPIRAEFTQEPRIPFAYNYRIKDEVNAVMIAKEEISDDNGVIRGSYSYVSPDGILRTTTYVADANGFHPLTVEEPASGLEIPNPSGTIETDVTLPSGLEYGYRLSADEYYQMLQANNQRQVN